MTGYRGCVSALPPPPPPPKPKRGSLAGLIVAFVLWFFGAALNGFPMFAFLFGAQIDGLALFVVHASFFGGLLVVCLVALVVVLLLRGTGRSPTLVGWVATGVVAAGWITAWFWLWGIAAESTA